MKNNKKKKGKGALIAVIVIVLAVAAAVAVFFVLKRDGKAKDGQYKTAAVERGSITASVSGSGTVQPFTIVDVKSNVGGTVIELNVDEGDEVTAGQVIAKIDPIDAKTALEQQQANLDSVNAKVAQSQETYSMQRVQSQANLASAENALKSARTKLAQAEETLKAQPQLTDNAIQQARANFDFAQKDLDRNRELLKQGFVPKSDVDSAQQKYDVAKAQLDSAQANSVQINLRKMDVDAARSAVKQSEASLQSARAGLTQDIIRQKDIVQAQAQQVSAKASVTNAQTQLGYTTILAPRAGVVVKKYVDVGSIVTGGRSSALGSGAGVSLVQIADTTRMQAIVQVDETDIGRIKDGQFVNVVLDAYPDVKFKGKVTKIAPQAVVSQNVTTVPVTVDIIDADKRLKPGLNANCDFITGNKKDVLIVPNEAIKDSPRGGKIVMVLAKGELKPTPRKVEIGLEGDDNTEIVSGLEEGEQVVTGTNSTVTQTGAGTTTSTGGGQGGQGSRQGGQGGGRGPGGAGHGPRMF